MNIIRIFWPVLVAGPLLGVAVPVMAVEALIKMTPQQQVALGISVAEVMPAIQITAPRLPGEITVPVGQERVVSAAQSGLIDAMLVAAGQSVKKGQPLAHLVSPELVLLQRDYLQAQTQVRLAKNTLDRDAELFKDGIIAERRYLTTQSAYEELHALVMQRRQALKLSGMGDAAIDALEKRATFSSGMTIVAPMDGQVLEQMATAGQRVEPAMPLLRIGRLTPLWLEVHAPVEALGSIVNGMQVTIPKYAAEGRVIAVIRNINKNDQTMHVRAEITRNAEQLSPGQFVEAELAVSAPKGGRYRVPKRAVIRNGGASYVFVQSAQGFLPTRVEVANEQGDGAVINQGLSGREKVAVSGTSAIKAAWVGTGGGD